MILVSVNNSCLSIAGPGLDPGYVHVPELHPGREVDDHCPDRLDDHTLQSVPCRLADLSVHIHPEDQDHPDFLLVDITHLDVHTLLAGPLQEADSDHIPGLQ